MNKEMMEMMLPYLQQLADKMGTSAEYLWKMQLQQAYVDGARIIAFYVFTLLCLLATLKVWNYGRKLRKEREEAGNDEETSQAFVFLLSALAIFDILSLIACFFKFHTLITILFNPEYYAFMNLYKLITHSF